MCFRQSSIKQEQLEVGEGRHLFHFLAGHPHDSRISLISNKSKACGIFIQDYSLLYILLQKRENKTRIKKKKKHTPADICLNQNCAMALFELDHVYWSFMVKLAHNMYWLMVHWCIHPYFHGRLHSTLQYNTTLVMWLGPLMEKQRQGWGNIVFKWG